MGYNGWIGLFSSLLSICTVIGVHAQEVYEMYYLEDTLGDSYLEVYKRDFTTYQAEKQWELAADRFEFFNNPDLENFRGITAFQYTEDRTGVYMVESQGEFYFYDIVADTLALLCDAIPEYNQGVGIWELNGRRVIQGFIFLSEEEVLFFGRRHIVVNLVTQEQTLIREMPDINEPWSQYETDRNVMDRFVYNGEPLCYTESSRITRSPFLEPDSSELVLDLLTTDILLSARSEKVVYREDCDSTDRLFGLGGSASFLPSIDSAYWFELDPYTGDHTPLFQWILPYDHERYVALLKGQIDIWSPIPAAVDTCHYNLDLDGDDSSISGKDYRESPDSCGQTVFRIADFDAILKGETVPDSLVLRVVDGDGYLEGVSGNYVMTGSGSSQIVYYPEETTLTSELRGALLQTRYHADTGDEEVRIFVTPWWTGFTIGASTAYLSVNPEGGDAGEDMSHSFCTRDSLVNLIDLVSEDADEGGQVWDMVGNPVSEMSLSLSGDYSYLYIVEGSSACVDTALLTIQVLESPEVMTLEDQVLCQGESYLVDLTSLEGSIEWSDGSEDKLRELDQPGFYSYRVSGEQECKSSWVTIELQWIALEERIETAEICQGEVYQYGGEWYSETGEYVDTLISTEGCDSIYEILDLRVLEAEDLLVSGPAGICPGEVAEYLVESGHEEIYWEGSLASTPLALEQGGEYELVGVDAHGCRDTIMLVLEEYDVVSVDVFEISGESYSLGDELQPEYMGPIVEYSWLPMQGLSCYDCPYPVLESTETNNYEITIMSEEGCRSQGSIELSYEGVRYFVPNVLSRLSDSPQNRRLYLMSNAEVEYSLEVYNRWGGKVYHGQGLKSNDMSHGWQPESELNPGVYIYHISILSETGGRRNLSGDITIL